MRIGIDARYLSHGLIGGVHTYLYHLVPALIDLATEHEILLYVDTKAPFELGTLPDRVSVRWLPWRSALSTLHYDFRLRRLMARDGLDVAHFPANYGFGPASARTVITMHDAMNLLPLGEILRGAARGEGRPPVRTLAMSAYLHYCSLMSLRRADLILTVSEHAGHEIARYGAVDPARVVAIPSAPSPDLRRVEDPAMLHDVRRRHDLPASFVLADALKNPALLVNAWRMLPASMRVSRQIVFFSRRQSLLPIVGDAVEKGDARLLIQPTRDDLVALYSMADAFVFPSWMEGFGLPVLEAMACGAPVVASDRGAIPEVAGGAALLSDAEDAEALARHLVRILGDTQEAERLRHIGVIRAAQFSWRQTAERVLDAYVSLVHGESRSFGTPLSAAPA